MFTLPDLTLEDVPLRLDGTGRIVICDDADAVLLGEFIVSLKADDEDWKITGISLSMGKARQSYTALNFDHLVREVAEHKESAIEEHVAGHLGDAKVAAEFDAQPSYKRAV